jgi:hypothetical protein
LMVGKILLRFFKTSFGALCILNWWKDISASDSF